MENGEAGSVGVLVPRNPVDVERRQDNGNVIVLDLLLVERLVPEFHVKQMIVVSRNVAKINGQLLNAGNKKRTARKAKKFLETVKINAKRTFVKPQIT